MRIANPMYDAAFKYLMDDQAAARLLVGAVLGEEVVSLEALPQERVVRSSPPAAPGEPPTGEMLTVRRVDFAATVRTATGERLRVLVEVQKARFTDEVMRFREYLGRHYADRDNYDEGRTGGGGTGRCGPSTSWENACRARRPRCCGWRGSTWTG